MEISIALVTRDRPESLARCLESWRAQSDAPTEIIVADDSNLTHARRVQELARYYRCRYVKGPQRGLYANRNAASLQCQGTHILSADDDHTHPADYFRTVRHLAQTDPQRIWIFGERHADQPAQALECPPELHPSGAGQRPLRPDHCAAIADGASVCPRRVFESGLRYDEAYPFGPLWYLWGQQLSRRGWRITFSDATFVWHHIEATGPLTAWNDFQVRLEATQYVAWIYALWLNPSPRRWLYATLLSLRRTILATHFGSVESGCRLRPTAAWRAFERARAARSTYQSLGSPAPGKAPKFQSSVLTSLRS